MIGHRLPRLSGWTLAMLLGAALGGVPAAGAAVSFQRTDIPVSGPDSVAIGDLDGKNGKDIAVALWSPGSVGVLLNKGNGTFTAMKTYSAGPTCPGLAVDITLGDLTPLPSDGRLDAYVACQPNVVRLRGDGTGALTNPEPFNLAVADYTDPSGDMLALMRRPDGNPAPLLVLQHATPSSRQLCISYQLDPEQLVCNATPAAGPLVVGDLNGSVAGVPPDEVIASEGGDKMGIFGFPPTFPLTWGESSRTVPGGVESAALGDIDGDHDLDVISARPVNSLATRANSIHYAKLNPSGSGGLEQVATALPSTPGVDAVAVADVDGNGCNDIVAAGLYGTPGPGQDTVAAQGGNDEIFARDSTRDTIDCGAGVDKVKADRSDSVKNCEYVKRPVRRARRH